jgi:uncharacterized repeat protein (TIGR03803 family)
VVIGSGGVLYGTTLNGGSGPCTGASEPGCGVVFSLTPGAWKETVLHEFIGGSDGVQPFGPVVIGTGGVLYGTTLSGGTANAGTVFSLAPPTSPGGAWAETVLHTFTGGFAGGDGADPNAGVVIGSGRVLYGTTEWGGNPTCTLTFACGTVFSLTPPASPGGAWTETVLHEFIGEKDGDEPIGPVVIGKSGVLYGTTFGVGGASSWGTVFSLRP